MALPEQTPARAPKPELTLFDSTSLIVGIIIGAGIYQMAPDIAKGVGGPWGVIGIWVLGGLLSVCGALSYAELATTYPFEGGDYVYLNRAYGSWAGFLFAWAQFTVVRPGDIAVMAFAFGTYAKEVWNPFQSPVLAQQVYAVAAASVLTLINVLGVREGKWTQNLLTTAKAGGLLLVVVAAFSGGGAEASAAGNQGGGLPASLALIFVLFTYGGWNEMAYVAAEVKDPRRNIGRALILGTAAVTVLYLLANLAFLHALGYTGLAGSSAVATETVARVMPKSAAILVSVLVCVSALGAVNGLVFTGARISYAVGKDYRMFAALGRWHPKFGTPAFALLLQGAIVVALIVILGTFVNAVLYTAATVYSFYLASSAAVLVLRRKEPNTPRPFQVPVFPAPTLLFCAVCVFLIHSAVVYKPVIALVSLGLLVLGGLVWRITREGDRPPV